MRPLIFAHRGSSILAPENTATAFDLAVQYKSDVLETDVRLSKDGVVMVFHDEHLNRTTNGRGKVCNHTYKQLKTLDAGFHFKNFQGESYAGHGIKLLSLNELFARYPTTPINIDIKDQSMHAAAAVAQCINNNMHENPVNVGSFHAPAIKHFRTLCPKVCTAATRGEVAKLLLGHSAQPEYQSVQIPISYWGLPLARKSFINRVQSKGLSINYWTINDKKSMRLLLEKGVNGIVTDRPDMALDCWTEKFGTM